MQNSPVDEIGSLWISDSRRGVFHSTIRTEDVREWFFNSFRLRCTLYNVKSVLVFYLRKLYFIFKLSINHLFKRTWWPVLEWVKYIQFKKCGMAIAGTTKDGRCELQVLESVVVCIKESWQLIDWILGPLENCWMEQ